jgi:DNA-binding transcriptional LysR family regulator
MAAIPGDRDELFVQRAFGLVASTLSFTATARALRVEVSTVTRALTRLEARVGARLVSRSTHALALTDAGREYRAHVDEWLARDAAVRVRLAGLGARTLRVTVPLVIAERVLPLALPAVLARHPDARLDVHSSDDRIDLVAGAFDLAIRQGPLVDSTLRARRIATFDVVLCAAPALMKRLGAPREPADIAAWPCLSYGNGPARVAWTFRRARGEAEVVTVEATLRSNNLPLLVAAAEAGHGAVRAPAWFVRDALRARRLVTLLAGWQDGRPSQLLSLYAVHPDDPTKAKLRNDFIAAVVAAAAEAA